MLLIMMILFPVLAGVLISAVPALRNRWRAAGAACLILTDLMGIAAVTRGGEVTLFPLTQTQALAFSVDALSRFFLALTLVMYSLAGIYAMGYLEQDKNAHQFFGVWFISMGAVLSACEAANLVTLYLSFEMATLTTMPLVLHDRTPESIAAAKKYLFYSIGGALMGLSAVLVLVPACGERFVYGGTLIRERVQGREGLFLTAVFLGVVGFGAKAGMYPLHGWLPTAHPVAPAPASALLSGLIVKAGILAVIRLVYFSAGPELIRGTWVQTAWLCLALVTIFMGSMMAWREKILKKRLAYSTVSQLSYIMLALALLCGDGLKGGLLHAAQHACAKGALFMCAGIFLHLFGGEVDRLRGVGKKTPVVLCGFAVAALSLVGIPPFGGFISKWQIAVTALAALPSPFSYIAPTMLLLSALLTAGYLFTVVVEGFYPMGGDAGSAAREKVSPLMTVPILLLCAGTLAVGLFGNGWIGGW